MKSRWSKLWKNMRAEKWLLLLCFVLGFLSWQGIRRNISFEVPVSNISVDIEVPENWAVWEKSINHINILFAGSKEDIRYLNNEQLRVVIPVTEPTAGEQLKFEFKEKYLSNPTGAKVVRFSPPEIFVKLDQKSERVLPVKAAISGSLPEGLEIDRIVCNPTSVRVFGAEQALSEMQNVHTKEIDLSGRNNTFKVSVPIALPQAGRMQTDQEWVSVDFVLIQRNSTEELIDIPVKILCNAGVSRNMELHPKTINITLRGQKQRIEQFMTADVFAYIDCTGLTETTGYDVPVNVDLPDGLQLISTDPAVIHVDMTK